MVRYRGWLGTSVGQKRHSQGSRATETRTVHVTSCNTPKRPSRHAAATEYDKSVVYAGTCPNWGLSLTSLSAPTCRVSFFFFFCSTILCLELLLICRNIIQENNNYTQSCSFPMCRMVRACNAYGYGGEKRVDGWRWECGRRRQCRAPAVGIDDKETGGHPGTNPELRPRQQKHSDQVQRIRVGRVDRHGKKSFTPPRMLL